VFLAEAGFFQKGNYYPAEFFNPIKLLKNERPKIRNRLPEGDRKETS